ncbi:MAG: electron transport complex protein RnfE [Gammaproteobacteria bacterium]
MTARLIGLCPLLAVSNTALKGAAITLLLALVVLCAASVTALLRRTVSWRLQPIYHALITSFITALVLAVARIEYHALVATLSIYPALIASNCLLLSYVQEVGERSSLRITVRKCARDCMAILVFMIAFGALRELATFGTVFTDTAMLSSLPSLVPQNKTGPLPILADAPGALILLALVLAGANGLRRRLQGDEPTTLPDSVAEPSMHSASPGRRI